MAHLIFEGTPEQRASQVEHYLRRLDEDFYGKDGLMQVATAFMTRADEQDRIQKQRHEENSRKLDAIATKTTQRALIWNIVGVLISLAALGACVLFGILSYKAAKDDFKNPLVHNSPAYTAERK